MKILKRRQFFKYLQCRGVFACHCTLIGDRLIVGICILDPEEDKEGYVRLVAPDVEPLPTFTVFLGEELQVVNYNIQLEVIS